jgi:hypothetical protein
MNENEKEEFEEFLKWKQEKSNQTDSSNPDYQITKNVSTPPVDNAQSSGFGWKSGCGIGCLGVIILFLILAAIGGNSQKQAGNDVVDWSEASVMSEQFLKELMKYPDDVVFIKESRNVSEEGGKVFKVTGRMKANNSFGQAVPYTYNIRIKYNGGDWSSKYNWSRVGGNLYNEATQEFTEF